MLLLFNAIEVQQMQLHMPSIAREMGIILDPQQIDDINHGFLILLM